MKGVFEIADEERITMALTLDDLELLPWSSWLNMPSPTFCRKIEAYRYSGVYQIKNRSTQQFIQFGISVQLRRRMKSFFPEPYGSGRRNNKLKREHVLSNWQLLQYRYLPTRSRALAKSVEDCIKSKNHHLFNT